MNKKPFSANVELKDADQGIVTARICTMGVPDSDADIIERGAFGTQEVLISQPGHAIWDGAHAAGKGMITETGDTAIFTGQFWLDTIAGRETFLSVKHSGNLQRWSWGFETLKSAPDTVSGQRVKRISAVRCHEVSPVLRAASVGTETLSVKSRRCTCGGCTCGANYAPPDGDAEMSLLKARLLGQRWHRRQELKAIHFRLIRDMLKDDEDV